MSQPLPFVATGVANIASVTAAFARLGQRLAPASDRDVAEADALVVPGVGHFAAARAALDAHDLVPALRDRMAAGRPTLGICLGMQLFCAGSDEAPGTTGVAVVPGRLRCFAEGVRCPQMGWNRVVADDGAALLRTGDAYFANSYALRDVAAARAAGFALAVADHGGPFVAALERGPVLLCQFHPELSADYGHELLRRWLRVAGRETATPRDSEVPPC